MLVRGRGAGGAGTPGPEGDSAYDIAVANGFVGTEADWLESLVGPEGDPGAPGQDGEDGEGAAAKVADARNIVTRAYAAGNGSLSNGTNTGGNYKVRHKLMVDAGVVELTYVNHTNGIAGPNDITVEASIERSDGRRAQVRFTNGATKVVIPPNGHAVGTVPLFQLKGTTFYEHVFVEPRDETGELVYQGKWPRHSAPPWWKANQDGERSQESVGETSLVMSGNPSGTTINCYFAAKITSVAAIDPITSVGVLGDSISVGAGDTSDRGMFYRAMDDNYAYMLLGKVGESASYFNLMDSYPRRWELLAGCTHIWSNYGINDLASINNLSASVTKANLISIWFKAKTASGGAKVRQTTITPRSSSTDNYTTLENQTPDTNDAQRQEVNLWLRDGAPMTLSTSGGTAAAVGSNAVGVVRGGEAGHPLYADPTTPGDKGVDDVAAVLEEGTTGKWKISQSPADSFHPDGGGHAAAAAILNLNWLSQ